MLKRIIIFILFTIKIANGSDLPPNAQIYLPELNKVIDSTWSNVSFRSVFAGQIEQETCITLKHRMCWSPYAELNTSREYGFGFGQITIVYDKYGRERFNNFLDVKKIDKRLKKWEWHNRFNPNYQLIALVAKDKYIYNLIKFPVSDDFEKMALMLAAYNGGLGGLIKDREVCRNTAGCDPSRWFEHIEKTSYKAKVAVAGYKKSFFDINREYVSNIMLKRRHKYISYLGS